MKGGGKLDLFLEVVAERLHVARVAARVLANMGNVNATHERPEEPGRLMDGFAQDSVNGRRLGKGDGERALWGIARKGIARIDFPLTSGERQACRKDAEKQRKMERDAWECGWAAWPGPEETMHGAYAQYNEHMAREGKDPMILIFDRRARIAAGERLLALAPEAAGAVSLDRRFVRPVRRMAREMARRQKLGL